jgi:hypothetical protein
VQGHAVTPSVKPDASIERRHPQAVKILKLSRQCSPCKQHFCSAFNRRPTRVAEANRDGDHVFTSFDGTAFRLIGGTGKYGGISGSASYAVTPEPSLEPGQYGYVMENDVTWTVQPAAPAVDGEVVIGRSSASPR